ncbi:hypothetical protein VUR80DRAFT_9981 [Thermomyces stellatus]
MGSSFLLVGDRPVARVCIWPFLKVFSVLLFSILPHASVNAVATGEGARASRRNVRHSHLFCVFTARIGLYLFRFSPHSTEMRGLHKRRDWGMFGLASPCLSVGQGVYTRRDNWRREMRKLARFVGFVVIEAAGVEHQNRTVRIYPAGRTVTCALMRDLPSNHEARDENEDRQEAAEGN